MWHLIRERIPSLMRGRPGPSSATDPNPRLIAGLDRAFKMGPCAMPAGKASLTHLPIQRRRSSARNISPPGQSGRSASLKAMLSC